MLAQYMLRSRAVKNPASGPSRLSTAMFGGFEACRTPARAWPYVDTGAARLFRSLSRRRRRAAHGVSREWTGASQT